MLTEKNKVKRRWREHFRELLGGEHLEEGMMGGELSREGMEERSEMLQNRRDYKRGD